MTPAEKDAAVLALLQVAWPLAPRDIARHVGISDDSAARSLKRIGAIRHPGGRYSAPAAADAERAEALPPFVCVGCRRRVADYAGSRASGAGRKCRACVGRGA